MNDAWHTMVDLETADTKRSALVLSCAAMEFKLIGKGAVQVRNRKLWVPETRDQLVLGRTVNPQTMQWWSMQDSGARLHWQSPALSSVCSLTEMLHGLGEFIFNAGKGPVWAHGIVFDIGILEDLYGQTGIEVPWKYGDVRDVRTVVRELPRQRTLIDHDFMVQHGLVPHDPLSDCEHQIYNLAEFVDGPDPEVP